MPRLDPDQPPGRLELRGGTPDWLTPGVESSALERYVRIVRERWRIIAIAVAVTLAGSVLYLAQADPVYEAEADLLISPAAGDDDALIGLGLIRESSDPTRDVETVARLVTAPSVARIVKEQLDSPRSIGALIGTTAAEPVAQSNLVAITSRDSSAEGAQALANAFGRGLVQQRSEQLQRQVAQDLEQLQGQRRSAPDAEARAALDVQISQLETLSDGPDPTVTLATPAEAGSQVAPRPMLSLAAALVGGLVVGLIAAFLLELFDPRLRREEQLRGLTRLPILARVPRESAGTSHAPLKPDQLSPGAIEAYRALRATLSASRGPSAGPRSVLVTGASSSEGKTTTAINLAASLAYAGHRVILVEADLRRPAIGRALGIVPEHDLLDVLLEEATLEDALVETERHGPNLRCLLASGPRQRGGVVVDGLFLPTARTLIDEAKQHGDFVIVDSPPLTEVIDGLALAERSDEVLVVCRLGRSVIGRIVQLGELLARHGIQPVGFALVGVPPSATASDYYVDAASTPRPPEILSQP
jgi:polysaccharide biosynthesis transport protein